MINFKKILPTNNRSLRQVRTILLSVIFKGGGIIIGFILVPVSLKYLNNNYEYGIWLTISSIVSWINFFDGGLGNGLKNKLSESLANNDFKKSKEYISTAYIGLACIVLLLIVIFFLINSFINWNTVLKIPMALGTYVYKVVTITFLSFFLKLVFDLINSVLAAYQKLEFVSVINFVGNLSLCFGIYLLLHFPNDSHFVNFCLIYSVIPLVISLFFNMFFFFTHFKVVRPSFKYFRLKSLKSLLTLGTKFFIIQMAVLIIFSTDNLIITQLFSPKEVIPYNLCYKYFAIISFLWNIIISPYWVAFNEAYVKKDYMWIKKTVKQLEKLLLLLIALIIVFILIAKFFFELWVGSSIPVPASLTVYMGVFIGLSCSINIYIYLINGLGKIRIQLYTSIVTSFLNIPLCLIVVKIFHAGIEGIILSSIICVLPSLILGKIQYNKIVESFIIPNESNTIWFQ